MTPEQISELVELVLAGNKEAFEEIYNETIGGVYRTLYVLTGSERDAEDVAQNVYLELYRNLNKYDRSRSLLGWVYGITIRQHQAYKRKRWREYRKERKEREKQTETPPTTEEAVLERFTGGHNDFVIVALNKLPDKLKQVLVLRYINELSQQEIADGLGIPVSIISDATNNAEGRTCVDMRKHTRHGFLV